MDTVMIAPSKGEEVEVLAKAKRRRFTLEYKRWILREAERCRPCRRTSVETQRHRSYRAFFFYFRGRSGTMYSIHSNDA